MAVCETPLFTNDSDMNNHEFSTEHSTDTSSENSAILLGGKRKKGGGGGNLQGTRRSSRRLSKESSCDGDGDGDEYHQSDDSDPHIDVNVDVIMTNAEEKLMTDEEQKANDRDRIENQMLAVALVKSVVETKNVKVKAETGAGLGEAEKQKPNGTLVKDQVAKKYNESGENKVGESCKVGQDKHAKGDNSTCEDKSQTATNAGCPAMSTRRRTSGMNNNAKTSVSLGVGAPKVKIGNGPSQVATTAVKTVAKIVAPPVAAKVKVEPNINNANMQTTIGTTTRAMSGTSKNISTVATVSAPARTVVPSVTATRKPITASSTSTTTGAAKATTSTSASSSGTGTSTRSRTRASTRTKTMGLKAEYASVRESRYKAPPKPSLPVPNPILSPTTAAAVTTTVASVTNNGRVTRNNSRQTTIVKSEGTSSVATNAARSVTSATNTATNTITNLTASQQHRHPAAIITPSTISTPAIVTTHQAQPTPTPSVLPENNLLRVKQEEMSLPTQAQVPIDNVSNGNSAPLPNRRRIFSIDLDPEGFDFDLSLGMSIGTTDYTENASELPPIASTSYAAPGNNRKNSDGNISNPNPSAEIPPFRGRGMSFELFSFSTSSEPADMKSEALNGGRPRGDSIIFDPISFSDGGIHDENALRKRLGSPPLNGNEEMELLNSNNNTNVGYVETPLLTQHTQLQPQPQLQPPKQNNAATLRTTSRNNIPNPVSAHPAASFPVRKSGGGRHNKSSHHKVTSAYNGHHSKSSHSSSSSKKHYIASSGNGKDDTLHMPQGSAAAAAAAASLSSQIMQNTMNGTISHTSCPMELLNKGGRIGIYLPEARRERIAKFHSKRKNRIWRKRIKYDCRKKLADSRPRVKGRFVKSLEGDE